MNASFPHRDRDDLLTKLMSEVGLSREEATYYLELLSTGSADPSINIELNSKLELRGMVILSGDGNRLIPVHPRLGIANYYRTWREKAVREMNEKRMRTDKLILELIPVYEAAMEKRAGVRSA